MGRGTDPVEQASEESVDLYEVSTWEPRSTVDRIAVSLYRRPIAGLRRGLVAASLVIFVDLFVFGGLGIAVEEPVVAVFILLSAVPAFLVALYVWYADVTTGEPLSLLFVTFLLAILFAGIAAVVNSTVGTLVGTVVASSTGSAVIASTAVFFLVVGPIEELVKLLAVHLYAFQSDRFDAVIDGAVYGAAAGLGFATIENALFISQAASSPFAGVTLSAAGDTAATRALVGPGHVLYSAIAGYYLGLAKFNPDRAVPIALKGLLVAALFHAVYNTGTMVVPGTLAAEIDALGSFGAGVIYVVGFNLVIGMYLYRKLKRYRDAYHAAGGGKQRVGSVERTEFEPDGAVGPTPGRVDVSATGTTASHSPADHTEPIGPFDRRTDGAGSDSVCTTETVDASQSLRQPAHETEGRRQRSRRDCRGASPERSRKRSTRHARGEQATPSRSDGS